MKTTILAIVLLSLTAVTIYFYPTGKAVSHTVSAPLKHPSPQSPEITQVGLAAQNQKKIEVVFVLDTTGSMAGLIQGAKDNIWSIASSMASAQPTPIIRMGLVAYRDRGDAYVTKVADLTDDLDLNYGTLMEFQAAGGGDHPESVNRGLYEAVNNMSWSSDDDTYRVIFLVGDAPPKTNYPNEMQYPEIVALAKEKGIIINTILCGADQQTRGPWQQIANLSQGNFFQVEQSGSTVAVSTLYDDQIAALSRQLDDTRMYYGNQKVMQEKRQKEDATNIFNRSASVSSIARKAEFNVSAGGVHNFSGSNELVADASSGKIDIETINPELLPKELRSMRTQDRVKFIADKKLEREQLKRQISALTKKRSNHIRSVLAESETDEDSSIDKKIYQTIISQASDIGLVYVDDEPKY